MQLLMNLSWSVRDWLLFLLTRPEEKKKNEHQIPQSITSVREEMA